MSCTVEPTALINNISSSLTHEEAEDLFSYIGPRCRAISTAVVQIFGTEPPLHNVWNKQQCGLVIFTKDNNRKSYFIQVYDPDIKRITFEQEINDEFCYINSAMLFHQFEAKNQMVGLNFADFQEASNFYKIVQEFCTKKKQKKQKRIENKQILKKQQLSKDDEVSRTNQTQDSIGDENNRNYFFAECKKEKMQNLFQMLGLSQQHLSNPKTKEFIYNFITTNGGLDKFMKEAQSVTVGGTKKASNIYEGIVYSEVNPCVRPIPDDVDQGRTVPAQISGPKHNKSNVLPVPSLPNLGIKPSSSPAMVSDDVAASPIPGSSCFKTPPPPPQTTPIIPGQKPSRKNEIINGLGKIKERETSKETPASSRNCLLDQIAKGITLKKVKNKKEESIPANEGLTCALKLALDSRAAFIQYDSDTEDESNDDDDWDDD